jgi:ABC-type nitrate/sulfonate/bicarbonate transport system substrate-binding protein
MRRRLVVSLAGGLAALAAAVVVAVAPAGESRERVTLALDWVPNTNHAGIYVARAKGYLERQGIDLRILPYTGASTDVLVASGKADLGISFVPSLLVSRASGLRVRAVADVLKRNEEALAVLADSRFKRPRDLTGSTYGGFGAPFEAPLWGAIIRADGGDPSFRSATLDTAAYEALYKGRVDFSSVFLGWEGIEARQRGIRLRMFRPAKYLGAAGDYPSVILIASDEGIADRAPVLRRALAALSQGYVFAARRPAETARILEAADDGLRRNPALVRASARFLAPAYADGGRWGVQTLPEYKALGDLLWRAGVLKDRDGKRVPRPDFSTYYTNALLPKG